MSGIRDLRSISFFVWFLDDHSRMEQCINLEDILIILMKSKFNIPNYGKPNP